jgi:hypothetical protein
MGQHEIFGVQDEGKTAGLCSYFFVLGWSVSFFGYHKTEKTSLSSFQLRQTLFLYLSYIAVRYGVLPILAHTGMLTGIFTLFNVAMLVNATFIVLWAIGLIGASKGEQRAIPFLGRTAQLVFAAI